MSTKQTRRSISVSQDVYDKLKAWCEANGRSQSDVVEQECRKFLGMEPRVKVSVRHSEVSAKLPPVSAKVSTVSETFAPESTWVPAIELPAGTRNPGGVPSRVEAIKEIAEKQKVLSPEQEKAAKIFTF